MIISFKHFISVSPGQSTLPKCGPAALMGAGRAGKAPEGAYLPTCLPAWPPAFPPALGLCPVGWAGGGDP